jgi:hypothetical protein
MLPKKAPQSTTTADVNKDFQSASEGLYTVKVLEVEKARECGDGKQIWNIVVSRYM